MAIDLTELEVIVHAMQYSGDIHMQSINPRRLVALRRWRSLTRQALADEAHVSERQLARIESGSSQARQTTLERLAKALDVHVKVITGEEPPPEGDGVETSFEIDPENLKALRLGKGWSRSQLAGSSRVSERQIARIESAHKPAPVRMTTFNRIATALGADREADGHKPCQAEWRKGEGGRLQGARHAPTLTRLRSDQFPLRTDAKGNHRNRTAALCVARGRLGVARERTKQVDELIDRQQANQEAAGGSEGER